jgi:1-acyl-sn-glycerol-3-phosphate acyltransferase
VTLSFHAGYCIRTVPTPVYNVVAALSWPVLRGLYRLEATGLERLPAEGGLVLAANHTSSFDPWPLGIPLWPKRQLFFMGKAELFNPVLAPVLRGGGAFPVRRGERDLEAIETAIEICRRGDIVAMFPEGTRREKGLRKKFEHRPRTGSARIALGAGVPLVPAAVAGSDRLSRLAKLRVAYGDPVPLDDLASLPPLKAQQEATDRLMERIYALRATL